MQKIFYYIIFSLLMSLLFSSCNDNDADDAYQKYLEDLEKYQQELYDQYQIDSTLISNYLEENMDTLAVYHESSGIFYTIVEEGGDYKPNDGSVIQIKYKGMLLDGTIVDETTGENTAIFRLGDLITGWRIGLPLIGIEGKIILYLPSYYAYGSKDLDEIPPYSVLIFEIELVNFY